MMVYCMIYINSAWQGFAHLARIATQGSVADLVAKAFAYLEHRCGRLVNPMGRREEQSQERDPHLKQLLDFRNRLLVHEKHDDVILGFYNRVVMSDHYLFTTHNGVNCRSWW